MAETSLTDKQRAFVDAYLSNGFNGTQAAITAGYGVSGARVEGVRQLSNANIRAEVEEHFRVSAMKADEVLTRLADMARADMTDFVNPDTGAIDLRAVKAAGLGHVVKEYSYQKGKGMSIKLHDSQAALVNIGRHLALFTDKTEHSGEVSITLTPEQERRRKELLDEPE